MMFDGRDTRLCRHPPPVHVRSGDAHALERFRQWARQAASICSSAQVSSAIWLWSPAPMPWFLLIALSFFSAVAFRPWWTVLVGPILAAALGTYSVATEGANYDMHGLGYHVAAAVAAICVVVWFLGRGLVALLDR